MKRQLVFSKSGIPCLWENGGGMSKTGFATILCNEDGSKPIALYVRTSGQLSNADHALIPIKRNMYLIEGRHGQGTDIIDIYICDEITDTHVILRAYMGFHDDTYLGYKEAAELADACQAAHDKMHDYHCRKPYYIEMPF